jgi:hypothetical protein
MSDFFGGLNYSNIRFTDARINGGGPLPTSLSGPEGINGDPDGRYNFNDSLLSSIAPYAGPKDGRMGSDRNYQQIPHRKQYPVPRIYLPEPAYDAATLFDVSHPIDMGDLVFVVHMNYKHFILQGSFSAVDDAKNNTMPNYNVFCNICTVNYLLAGISNYVVHCVQMDDTQLAAAKTRHAWWSIIRCLNMDTSVLELRKKARAVYTDSTVGENDKKKFSAEVQLHVKVLLQGLVRDNIRPLGICSTSEKQGGQHEVGYKPVQAAASFFVTLTVDGQNRDLVNIWRGVDVEGGDLLLLQLEYKHMRKEGDPIITQSYTLNHYYKGWVQRCVQMHDACTGLFQLVPGVLRTAFKKNQQDRDAWEKNWCAHVQGGVLEHTCRLHLTDADLQKLFFETVVDNTQLGYWHIGQVYNKQAHFSEKVVPTDDMEMTRGQLLQVNFAPVWHSCKVGQMQLVTSSVCGESTTTKYTDAAVRRPFYKRLSLWLLQNNIHRALWGELMILSLRGDSKRNGLISEFLEEFLDAAQPKNAHVVRKNPTHPEGRHVFPMIHASFTLSLDEDRARPPGVSPGTMHALGGDAVTEPVASEAAGGPRFKKARGGLDAIAVEDTASSMLVDSTSAPAPTSTAPKAGADAGWDFEKDLEKIFATEARARSGDAADEKPRAKQKGKGP